MSGAPKQAGVEPGLLNKISALPDGKFVEALDVLAPIAETSEVTHFIEKIRPRLRKLQPRRRLTLKRILFQPVEDLFVAEPLRTGAPTIPRSTIALCWDLMQSREPDQMAALAAVLAKSAKSDPRALLPLSHQLWILAATTIAAAEKEGGVAEPVSLVGKVLAAASEIEAFKRKLPQRPLPRLKDNPRPLQEIKASVESIRARGRSVDGFILVVAARLESPAQLFRLMQDAEIPLPAAAARLLGAYVIDEVVKQADVLQEVREIRPEDAARDADRLFRTLTDAQRNLKGSMKSELDKGTQHVAGVIKELLGKHVIGAAAEVIGAAVAPAGSPPGTAPKTEQLVAAEAHARALARSRKLARHVGLESQASAAVSTIHDRLTASVDEALEGDHTDAEKELARKAVFGAIRLIELVAGPEEAERLLRRAQKRLAPGAPA
jgi:hypothetical protein